MFFICGWCIVYIFIFLICGWYTVYSFYCCPKDIRALKGHKNSTFRAGKGSDNCELNE